MSEKYNEAMTNLNETIINGLNEIESIEKSEGLNNIAADNSSDYVDYAVGNASSTGSFAKGIVGGLGIAAAAYGLAKLGTKLWNSHKAKKAAKANEIATEQQKAIEQKAEENVVEETKEETQNQETNKNNTSKKK